LKAKIGGGERERSKGEGYMLLEREDQHKEELYTTYRNIIN